MNRTLRTAAAEAAEIAKSSQKPIETRKKGGHHDRTEHHHRRRRHHDLVVKPISPHPTTNLTKGETIMVITISWTAIAIVGGMIAKGVKELSDDK